MKALYEAWAGRPHTCSRCRFTTLSCGRRGVARRGPTIINHILLNTGSPSAVSNAQLNDDATRISRAGEPTAKLSVASLAGSSSPRSITGALDPSWIPIQCASVPAAPLPRSLGGRDRACPASLAQSDHSSMGTALPHVAGAAASRAAQAQDTRAMLTAPTHAAEPDPPQGSRDGPISQ
jgi:hypothetical protein